MLSWGTVIQCAFHVLISIPCLGNMFMYLNLGRLQVPYLRQHCGLVTADMGTTFSVLFVIASIWRVVYADPLCCAMSGVQYNTALFRLQLFETLTLPQMGTKFGIPYMNLKYPMNR